MQKIEIMTNGEKQALAIAEKYKSNVSDEQKVKHLATEVMELGYALVKDNKANILEEIGDCAFLLLHILSQHNPSKTSLSNLCVMASEKMELRNKNPFDKAAKPLMEFMGKDSQPAHLSAMVTCKKAELFQGVKVIATDKYIED
jgi:NTP pyrophosphatase (non-canonical NTP hydrolase)